MGAPALLARMAALLVGVEVLAAQASVQTLAWAVLPRNARVPRRFVAARICSAAAATIRMGQRLVCTASGCARSPVLCPLRRQVVAVNSVMRLVVRPALAGNRARAALGRPATEAQIRQAPAVP
jgi:hypothetical protein